jgi:hypothetical protein
MALSHIYRTGNIAQHTLAKIAKINRVKKGQKRLKIKIGINNLNNFCNLINREARSAEREARSAEHPEARSAERRPR